MEQIDANLLFPHEFAPRYDCLPGSQEAACIQRILHLICTV
jgi:hypothetical protein